MNWLFWSLLSALFAASTAILSKVGVEGVNSNLATAVRTFFILIVTWGIVLATSGPKAIGAFSHRTWLFLGLSAVTTALSWLCYFRALQIGQVSRVASVDKISVVFAILLAALFLGEHLSWQKAAGGALIVVGAIVLAWQS